MNEVKELMEEYRELLVTREDEDVAIVFAMADLYFFYTLMETIAAELLQNVLITLGCVFAATIFLVADLYASLIVVTCVLLTLVDLGGFMYLWGINVDTITAIFITIALGLTVDYSAHITHAFVVEKGQSRQDRIFRVLVELGPAVLNGGLSTFLAFFLLCTSDSLVFLIFFKVFFLFVVFSLYHGLVFLPILLSLIGPSSPQPDEEDLIQCEKHPPKKLRLVKVEPSIPTRK